MNIIRFETEIHKDADKIHARAQESGEAVDYLKAAELYEKCGDFQQARVCRDAADTVRMR